MTTRKVGLLDLEVQTTRREKWKNDISGSTCIDNRFTCYIRLESDKNLYNPVGAGRPAAVCTEDCDRATEIAVEITTSNTRLFHDAVAPHVTRVAVVDAKISFG